MITRKLVDYIRYELSKGISFAKIKQKLTASGWSDEDINWASKYIGVDSKKIDKKPIIRLEQRNVFLLSVLVFSVLLGIFAIYHAVFGGIILLNGQGIIPTVPFDCGEDMVCFNNLAKNCDIAKVTKRHETVILNHEIRGIRNDLCVWSVERIDLTAEDGMGVLQFLYNMKIGELIDEEDEEQIISDPYFFLYQDNID